MIAALLCFVIGITDGDTIKARCGAPGAYQPASIPTLSEWGLFALSSLLALFAVGRVRRNQA